jgi:predicted DNA-binding protein (MmcQ/YjbR family)
MVVRKSPPSRKASPRSTDLRRISRELRKYALSFPEATEDFPWGERVAKVKGKVFVFLGRDPVPGGPMGLSVKLPESGQDALDLPFAKQTGYGLGKSGWVSATFEASDEPPLEILKGWIHESYCAVGPKKLVADRESPRLKSLSHRSRNDRRG